MNRLFQSIIAGGVVVTFAGFMLRRISSAKRMNRINKMINMALHMLGRLGFLRMMGRRNFVRNILRFR
ncbi:hypothetical protein BHF71_03040 [Vulcanibacillus modesticaldus]|uniref:Uncharacterized protein n=1 Tax=Vulcanibacillus modesticaldus TaxID=337097 RepID=A0A1D2YTA9_9BACI|nr:hypothetical protein [Vulcanibacillus modesticaldus]OEF98916.1 hypothetical protein BHF71_03040 [Vulcanibacillus modesticaldus]